MLKSHFLIGVFLGLMGLANGVVAQTADSLQKEIDKLKIETEKLKADVKAGDSDGDFDKPYMVNWGPAPTISSADGNFAMKVRGKVFTDFGWINDDGRGKTLGGTTDMSASEIRAARFGIEGKAWRDVVYRFRMDFSGGTSRIIDAYIGKQNFLGLPVELQVGLMKIGTSLETNTSGNYTNFMERSSLKETTSFTRRMGFGLFHNGELYSLQFGVQRGTAAKITNNEGWQVSGRGHRSFKVSNDFIHLAVSARWRKNGKDEDAFRYRARPFHHLAPRFIDTGSFAGEDITLGLEAAYISGPFSVEAEAQSLKAKYDVPAAGLLNPSFKTGYISATWFVTGEDRNYSPDTGGFGRPKVNNPIHKGGTGAWQLSLKVDYSDLSDEAIFGGKQTLYVAGVNWHLNRHTRLMLNISKAKVTGAYGANPTLVAIDGKNTIDIVGLRAQVDF
jgi:phosphate-selective porin OprO/OprP